MQMSTKKNSTMAICLTAILALSPVGSFAQATTTFSGEAVALRASALGIALALSDTGPLPSSGGELCNVPGNPKGFGLASADAVESNNSGPGGNGPAECLVRKCSP